MDSKENINPDFQKGFNEGYVMGKHMPELAGKIAEALKDTKRGVGFKQGLEEYLIEKTKVKLPNWLKENRLKDLDRKDNIEKEKSDLEKDI